MLPARALSLTHERVPVAMPPTARPRRKSKTRKSTFDVQNSAHVRVKPRWDRTGRKLWFGTCLVKEFPRPSDCQVLILEAFEEQGWPESIDDPLPHDPDIDPKHRLHDAIKRLNRKQRCSALSFHGNGNGEGIVCILHTRHKSSAP
jgi:hypothetical protein